MAAGSIGIIRSARASGMRRSVATVAGLAITSSALACTPPLPFNIALDVQVQVDGGGALVDGATGVLTFSVHRVEGHRWPRGYVIRSVPVDPQVPGGSLLRLTAIEGEGCALSEDTGWVDGSTGAHYALTGERIVDAPSPRLCWVGFEGLPGAVTGQSMRFFVRPDDVCPTDPDWSDNDALVPLGVPPPAIPAPLAPWLLPVLALALGGLARRQLRASAGRMPRS